MLFFFLLFFYHFVVGGEGKVMTEFVFGFLLWNKKGYNEKSSLDVQWLVHLSFIVILKSQILLTFSLLDGV